MIPMKFVPPNYRARVSIGVDGKRWWRLENGGSEQEVHSRLSALEFTVHQLDAYDFDTWLAAAREETARVIEAQNQGSAYEWDETLWGELKDYLFRLFYQKCAYCEGARGAVTSGAVEHYRPKTGVLEDPGHPGYYWLAYDFRNYVPVCSECNSIKGKRFPIQNDANRARKPGDDLEREGALLLNPYEGDSVRTEFSYKIIWDSKTFSSKLISVAPNSRRAEISIEVLGLNRDRLREQRAEVQSLILNQFAMCMAVRPNPVLQALKEGRKEYSAATLAALEEMLGELSKE
jgi:hypothetical protein